MRGIEAQFLVLQKGFSELIAQHLLRPFDERELEVRELPVILEHVTEHAVQYVICICHASNMFYASDTVVNAQNGFFK